MRIKKQQLCNYEKFWTDGFFPSFCNNHSSEPRFLGLTKNLAILPSQNQQQHNTKSDTQAEKTEL